MHTYIGGLKQHLTAGLCTLRTLWEGLELGALLALGLDLPYGLQEKAHILRSR